jgi:hypothetical protein
MLKKKCNDYGLSYPDETIIICGLLHDLCKINFYKPIMDYGKIKYIVENNLPLGHGEKSLSIIQDYIKLLREEKLAIRWHMGSFTLGFNEKEVSREYYDSMKMTKLVFLLFISDYEATVMIEG